MATGSPQSRTHLTGVQETLFIPLYAKALDARRKRSVLHDVKADELVRAVGVDYAHLVRNRSRLVLVVRARHLDEWVRSYLIVNPSSVVLNLGCGLDSRILRISPPMSSLWIDLDLPEVIEVRRQFYSEGDGYRMIGASLTDPDWLEPLPSNRPVLVVADGVFEYLSAEQIRSFLGRLTGHFPRGEVVFDTMSSVALERGNRSLSEWTTARLQFAVDDLAVLDALNPKLQRVEVVPLLRSRYHPLGRRMLFTLATIAPSLRRVIRLVRCEFPPALPPP